MTTKKERTIIHLEYQGKHYYFGSMVNMYDYFSAEDLGIAYTTLRNYGLSADKPFKNEMCVIRKGILHTKDTQRGKYQR